jgi:16S rRNA (guanine966-N2)-methyltransferase
MRIIAGEHKGRAIVAPGGQGTRPTADRTRQALFNVLEHAPWGRSLVGARAADLFAGSGALGLEALSRGADLCLFADHDAAARAVIARNVAALKLEARCEIKAWDATRLAPRAGSPFDLVFLDPPYGKGLVPPTLTALRAGGWLAAGALVVVETGAGEMARDADGFEALDARMWGAATVTFLRSTSSESQ